jgi:hypothetical protein
LFKNFIIEGPNNILYVLLDGRTLWRYDEANHGWKNTGNIEYTYPRLESDVRGGVKCKKGYTWFFKSNAFQVIISFPIAQYKFFFKMLKYGPIMAIIYYKGIQKLSQTYYIHLIHTLQSIKMEVFIYSRVARSTNLTLIYSKLKDFQKELIEYFQVL